MEIDINTEFLENSLESLTKSVLIVEANISRAGQGFKIANDRFDTVNYDTANANIQKAMHALQNMQDGIQEAKRFLQQIGEIVEKYEKICGH